MKKSLFSIVTLFIFSVALTACGGGGGGGGGGGSAGGGGGGDPFAPSDNTVLNAVDSLPSKNSQKLDNSYDSFDDVSTAANGGTAIDITLGGLAVTLNDITQYTRETTDTAWTDRANLQIDRQITPARITSPFVTFTFDADGNISGVASEYIKAYTATGNTPLSNTRFAGTYQDDELSIDVKIDRSEDFFGFDSAHMAYIGWNVDGTLSDGNDDVATTQTIYDIDGMVIAGIQTADASIPTSDLADFVGKGSGVYGTKIGRYDTNFDIAGIVSFSARSLSLTTSNTACTANCDGVTVPSYLNFTATNLSFANADNTASINRISADLKLNSALTGTLDARFYGDKAQEFGGTFTLAEASTQTSNGRYYYGAFGARFGEAFEFMGGVSTTKINAHDMKVATSSQDTNIGTYDSLSNISVGTVTLQGLTILLDDTSIYMRETTDTEWTDAENLNIERTINASRLTSSAVSLAFAGGNALVTTIYADKTHTPNTATLNVDSSDIFGFDSDYMAYISWNSDKTDLNGGIREEIYNIDGAMIAGIETDNENFLASGYAVFEGKGTGVYGFLDSSDKLTRYNTNFTTKATVDFTARNVALTTATSCTDCNDFDTSALNFTGLSLSFADGNNISKDVTVDSTLTGTLDARFYGGEAQEFGGTFALAEASTDTIAGRYYYGAFGAKRGDFVSFVAFHNTTIPNMLAETEETPQATDIGTHMSLSAIASDTITLQALGVGLNDSTTYTRNQNDAWTVDAREFQIDNQIIPTRLTKSAVTLEFNDAGHISAVTSNFMDEQYKATSNTTYQDGFVGAYVNNALGLSVAIRADRSTIFGFDSDYMVYLNLSAVNSFNVDTELTQQTLYDIDGYMIAGFETQATNFPTAGMVEFIGKGSGTYGGLGANNSRLEYNTKFTATAAVDFTAGNVAITTSDTVCTATCDGITVPGYLDFSTGLLAYTGNIISTDLTLNNVLTGKLDARFYGAGGKEFGGTFALTEADTSYYYGAFGTKILTGNTATINAAGILQFRSSQKVDTKGYASLDAVSTDANSTNTEIDVTLQGVAVAMENITDYTRYTTDKPWGDDTNLYTDQQITPKRVILPVVALNFDEDGNISGVTAQSDVTAQYINEYTATAAEDATLSSTRFTGTYSDGDIAITTHVDRSTIFGFASNNMAYVSWDIDNEVSLRFENDAITETRYDIDGYMIAGIQTADADIPTDYNFGFAGKGQGVYGNGDSKYATVFDVIAVVDITDRTIALAASNTFCPLYDCGINSNHLDFSGTLNYGYDVGEVSVATNDASGIVTGGSGLTGTADARFYGSVAQELGGTFLLTNANSYYYGAFGGQVAQYNGDELKTYNLVKPVTDLTLDTMAWNRNDPDNPVQVAVPDVNAPTYIDTDDENKTKYSYQSIDELRNDTSLANNTKISFTLPVLGAHRFYQNEFQRHDNTIAWGDGNHSINANILDNTNSVVTLNYHVKNGKVYYHGGAGTEGVVLYRKTLDDDGNETTNRYAANTGADNRNYFKGDDILGIDNTIFENQIKQSRGDSSGTGSNNYFGFVPENIVSLELALYRKSNKLSATDLTESWDVQFAYLIAGLETGKDFGNGAFGAIPTSGNVTFIGKGNGSYGYLRPQYASVYLSKREQVYFKMAANVDFGARNINFNIYNTCYATTCTIKRKGLDFNADISFDDNGTAHNNMSTAVTSSNGLLAGTLDTRFYGNAAQEFGGTFTLMGDNIYYYAIFAGNRTFDGTKDDFSVNIIPSRKDFETHYDYPKATNIPYGSFAKAAGANETSQFVLRGSAVQKHDITDYIRNGKTIDWNGDVEANVEENIVAVSNVSEVRDISITGSKTPALALDFDADGNIAAIEAYFGFNSYKTATLADGATGLSANGAISNVDYADAETSNIIADREAFGFTSDYMVYVNWNFAKTNLDSTGSVIADDIYNIDGMMVAGLETQTIPTTMPENSSLLHFVGAGTGNYGDEDADHALTFKTYADVNFNKRTIEFETRKTACVDITCTLDADTLNTLNLTRSLKYSAGVNRAGQTIRVASSLVGPLYARFYGIGDDSATEFGGTFAVRDGARYYYGAFGTYKAGAIINEGAEDSIKNVTIAEADRQPIDIPNDVGGASYPWLSLIIDDYRSATVQGPAAYRANETVYTRATAQNDFKENDGINTFYVSNLTGAGATIKPNAYGNLSELTIYLDNKESYTISDADNGSNTAFNKAFSTDDVSGHMSISRASGVFGFSPKNMYYVSWTLKKERLSDDENLLTDSTYTKRGVMLVGVESEVKQIPTKSYPALDSGPVKFSGKGRGYYNDGSGTEKGTKFNVTANVDFVNKNVSLSTGYLNLCDVSFGNCQTNTALNFVTAEPLSYDGGNSINGAIESRTYGENSSLAVGNFTGTVDANFYGIDTANEFGGAFTLIDDNYNTHYGIFGTKINSNSVFNHSFDHLKQDAVDRFPVAKGAVSPNRSDLKTYTKYDSFFAAQQDSKNGVKYDNVVNQYVHTPGVAAFREDTSRYQRYLADKNTAWDDDDVIEDLSFVGNIDNASSLIQYGAGSNGKIYGARAYGNKVAYLLNYANNSLNGHGHINNNASGGSYHYFTGGNPLKYYTTDTNTQNYPSNIAGNLTVEQTNIFGFQAQYMAYLRWSVTKETNKLANSKLADRVFDIDGYMVSGFQTEHNSRGNDGDRTDDLPETGTANFIGGGMGTYHAESGKGYRTNFDANATVDFAGTIDLTLNNTTCVVGLGDCGDAVITPALLTSLAFDLTGDDKISFTAGVNNITGIAADTDGGMAGQIDARFYGQNRVGAFKQNAAKEFGGAFSFRDGDKSYIGIFGTERQYSVALDKPVNFINYHELTGFNDENRTSKSNNALVVDSAVQIIKNNDDNSIETNAINDVVVEFAYKANDEFADNGLNLYVGDARYTITNGTGTEDEATNNFGGVTSSDDVTPSAIQFHRNNFGFTANYMAQLRWVAFDATYQSYHYGIAGFATDGGAIPENYTASFTGKGKGTYATTAGATTDRYFDITADVKFGSRTVTLTSNNTCIDAVNCSAANLEAGRKLNFVGDLTYDAGENALTGTFTTAGDDGNADLPKDGVTDETALSGNANAKFYGTGDDVATELGGTFNLSNTDEDETKIASYVGWFGAQKLKDYVTSNQTVTTSASFMGKNNNTITVPELNAQTTTSFTTTADQNTKDVTLAIDSLVQITKNTADNTIINDKFNGGVIVIDYANGIINADGADDLLEIYFADKNYTITNGNGQNPIQASGTDVASSDNNVPGNIGVYRDQFGYDSNSFTATYMAAIYWNVKPTNEYRVGFGITGYETANIPTTATVTFTGGGLGYYDDRNSGNAPLKFNITATADFGTKTVTLVSEDTCNTTQCDDANKAKHAHLNFTGTLGYADGTNALTSTDIATTGNADPMTGNADNPSMTGTADAKFYGPAAEEIGGTFNLSNEQAGYVGWFGAKKP